MRVTVSLFGATLVLGAGLLLAGCDNTPVSSLTPPPGATGVAQASIPAATPTPAAQTDATAQPASPTGVPAGGATTVPADVAAAPTPTGASSCAQTSGDINQGGLPFATPEVIESKDGALRAELVATFTDPATTVIANCGVHLRSYNGKLVGPTLRVHPGDTMYITLTNHLTDTLMLAGQPPAAGHSAGMHGDNVINITNLHTHGLHVSPKPGSDNVLLALQPGQSIPISIAIPPDHQAGTFWYHAHAHGSTAVQVSSGMEGALIIEGDVDQVPAIKAAEEQTLLLQQVYFDQQGQITTTADFGPTSWEEYNRQYTINGQLFPRLTMQPGEVQRWRLIHGGVRETTCVALVGPAPSSWDPKSITLEQVATLTPTLLHEIAVDGLTLGRMDNWKALELEPGYRSDVLVQAGAAGMYYLLDLGDPSGVATGINCTLRGDSLESTNLLATLLVEGGPRSMALPSSAELAALQRPVNIPDSELTGTQVMTFCVCVLTDTGGLSSTEEVVFTVNGQEFSESRERRLTLGAVEEWTLSVDPNSLAPAHPFHIHINPFQVTRTGPDGMPEIVWKDTLLVTQQQTLKIRTRYQDYDGKFVLHCHILDHEDQGMMELVEVVLPTPTPAALRPQEQAAGGGAQPRPAAADAGQTHSGHGTSR